jgi:inner membrane protein
MATILTHGIVGYTIAKICVRKPVNPIYWVLAFIVPMLPDLDVFGAKYGIRYEDCWGHRGAVHSIAFALAASMAIFMFFQLITRKKEFRLSKDCFLGLFLGMTSHGMIDALTNGGLGVAIFWPMSCQRYFFGFRPIEVSPLSVSRFFENSIYILKNEALWIWLPCIAILWLDYLFQRGSMRNRS